MSYIIFAPDKYGSAGQPQAGRAVNVVQCYTLLNVPLLRKACARAVRLGHMLFFICFHEAF